MKKLLLLVVSVLLTGFSYASNLNKAVDTKITNDNEKAISQQMNQLLILEQSSNAQLGVDWHYSHSSHSSHSSHRSHSSHYSSRFA